jgi:3-oxoacyl-[acyl-carrier protein] reductase
MQTQVDEISGKVVLVTGGATGLGRATARAFRRAGASVALNDRSEERVETAVRELLSEETEQRGVAAYHGFPADVSDGAAVRGMVDAVLAVYGRIDVLVANAGIYPNTNFLDIPEEEWDRVLDVNLKGCFLTCQAVARAMVAAGQGGTIVTLSSGAANNAIRGWAHYNASKAGVIMLTKTMAIELAEHGIRVNAILPGYIDVPEGGEHLAESYRAAARSAVPLGRPGQPEDIANAILLLASPLAGYVTGTTLVVDGGSSAGRAFLRPTGD